MRFRENFDATLAQDRQAMSEIVREFEGYIDEMLEIRVQSGAKPEDDVTAALMHEEVWGRPLSNEEIASILRNWTVPRERIRQLAPANSIVKS